MAELSEEDQERVWIRRLEGIAAMANQKSNEFRANLKTRQARRNDQADYLKEIRCPMIWYSKKSAKLWQNLLI